MEEDWCCCGAVCLSSMAVPGVKIAKFGVWDREEEGNSRPVPGSVDWPQDRPGRCHTRSDRAPDRPIPAPTGSSAGANRALYREPGRLARSQPGHWPGFNRTTRSQARSTGSCAGFTRSRSDVALVPAGRYAVGLEPPPGSNPVPGPDSESVSPDPIWFGFPCNFPTLGRPEPLYKCPGRPQSSFRPRLR